MGENNFNNYSHTRRLFSCQTEKEKGGPRTQNRYKSILARQRGLTQTAATIIAKRGEKIVREIGLGLELLLE